jgi:hypothetical protein
MVARVQKEHHPPRASFSLGWLTLPSSSQSCPTFTLILRGKVQLETKFLLIFAHFLKLAPQNGVSVSGPDQEEQEEEAA